MPIDPRPREGELATPARPSVSPPDAEPQGMASARAAGVPVPRAASAWQEQHAELFQATPSHAAVLRGPVACDPEKGMQAERFVVLHKQLGPLGDGDVVTRDRLMELAVGEPADGQAPEKTRRLSEEGLRRYLEQGSVRPASEFEATQKKVTLPRAGSAGEGQRARPGAEESLAARSGEVQSLRAQLASAQERLRQAEAKGVQPASVPQMEPKERMEMRAALQQLEDRCQALTGERDEARQSAQQWQAHAEGLQQKPAEDEGQGSGRKGRR